MSINKTSLAKMTNSTRTTKRQMGKILVVCAHPDDETLGLGGTIARYSKENDVFIQIFTDGQFGRDVSTRGIKERQNNAKKACSILGVKEVEFLNYTDERLDTIPMVEVACKIESAIKRWKPNTVFTHYWGDVNQDHKRVFEATLIAARPSPSSKIKHVICYETPSSTEWGHGSVKFSPNLFINIDTVLHKKIKALKMYGNEISDYPHPRSKDSIISRARYWGSTVGVRHAEAFVTIRDIV